MQGSYLLPYAGDETEAGWLNLLEDMAGGLPIVIGPRFMPSLAECFGFRRGLLALCDPFGGEPIELFGYVLEGGEARRIRRTYTAKRPTAERLWRHVWEEDAAEIGFAYPLKTEDAMLGWLVLGDRGGVEDEREAQRLRIVGHELAVQMDNWRLRSLVARDADGQLKVPGLRPSLATMRQLEVWQRSLRDVLFGDSGVGKVVETVGRLLGLSIILEDQGFHILARTRDVDGSAKPSGELFHITADVGRLANSTLLAKTDADGQEQRRSLSPLMAGKELLGYLTVLLPPGRELEADEKIILRYASVALVLQLLRKNILEEERDRLASLLIDEICFAEIPNEDAALAIADRLGVSVGAGHVVAVTEIEGPAFRRVAKDLLAKVRRRCRPQEAVVGAREGAVAVLCLEPGAKERARELAREMSEHLCAQPDIRWWTTIGPGGASVEQAQQSFLNGRGVNHVLRTLGRKNACFDYESLGIYGMLGVHPERFAWFAKELLGRILEYDEKHHTELVQTLKLYFASGQNVQATARSGFVAAGTVKYRLRRIAEMSDVRLGDPDTALQIQLALKFL